MMALKRLVCSQTKRQLSGRQAWSETDCSPEVDVKVHLLIQEVGKPSSRSNWVLIFELIVLVGVSQAGEHPAARPYRRSYIPQRPISHWQRLSKCVPHLAKILGLNMPKIRIWKAILVRDTTRAPSTWTSLSFYAKAVHCRLSV